MMRLSLDTLQDGVVENPSLKISIIKASIALVASLLKIDDLVPVKRVTAKKKAGRTGTFVKGRMQYGRDDIVDVDDVDDVNYADKDVNSDIDDDAESEKLHAMVVDDDSFDD
jgi:hypothetical protein